MEKIEELPLVSIIVITYNSSKYVLETLESAKAQTYQNIELIVSDDCSTDNTVEICRNWLNENKDRFVRTQLITVEKNTGIAPNCNRGLYKAVGEWVKFIAGDDALLDNCIIDNLNRISEINEEVYAVHSEVYYYREFFNKSNFIRRSEHYKNLISHPDISTKEQLSMFVRKIVPLAPTVFINRNVLIHLGGFNEELPYEDIPMWIKFANNNIKMHFLNTITVKYRIRDSVSNTQFNNIIFKPIYKLDKIVFDKLYINYLSIPERFSIKTTFAINDFFNQYNLNIKTPFLSIAYKILNYPFNMCWLLNVKIRAIMFKFKRLF